MKKYALKTCKLDMKWRWLERVNMSVLHIPLKMCLTLLRNKYQKMKYVHTFYPSSVKLKRRGIAIVMSV